MSDEKKPEDEQDPLADLNGDGDGEADGQSQSGREGGVKGPRGAVGSRGG